MIVLLPRPAAPLDARPPLRPGRAPAVLAAEQPRDAGALMARAEQFLGRLSAEVLWSREMTRGDSTQRARTEHACLGNVKRPGGDSDHSSAADSGGRRASSIREPEPLDVPREEGQGTRSDSRSTDWKLFDQDEQRDAVGEMDHQRVEAVQGLGTRLSGPCPCRRRPVQTGVPRLRPRWRAAWRARGSSPRMASSKLANECRTPTPL